jgi:calnexin
MPSQQNCKNLSNSMENHLFYSQLEITKKNISYKYFSRYEVKYEQGQECGGGYLKLLETEVADNLKEFNDKSPYVIMFGPDKCGMSSKVSFSSFLQHLFFN